MNALEINNLNKSFGDFKLDNLSLTLPGGCIMGLIGENGAGKSTTIKLILNILHKDSGSVTVLGRDNEKLTKEDVGVVMDEAGIPECMTPEQVGKVMANIFKNWDSAEYARLIKSFDLPENTPIISSGYSMGGYSALVYTRYSKRTPAACAALCPVCDFAFHYTERDDIPRTIYLAYMGYDMPFEEAIKSASPVELCDTMPDIPYVIYHGTADTEVRKDKHSDVFVAKMRALGRDVRYTEMEGLGHCAMTGVAEREYHEFVTSFS